MNCFENMLYEEIKDEILSWEEEGIYAISFFLESNELITYKDYSNLTTWSVSYNTEEDCDGAGEFDEERWNFAFWRQDEMMIIYFDEPNEVADELFEWYAEKGVTDFGEDVDVYNENKEYIGEEPAGRYELLQLAASFAEKLHRDGTIKEHFGKDIPIIVHGLEYTESDLDATEKANPDGQAAAFFDTMG